MRGEEGIESGRDGPAEEHVARLGSMGIHHLGARLESADLLERAGYPRRIAGELDRRGVGEKLALAAHRGLDEIAHEGADEAHQHQDAADDEQHLGGVAPAAPALQRAAVKRRTEQDAADQPDHEDPEEHAHEPDVEAHVPVQDVAELVADHPLQLVAAELPYASAGDTDHRITGREPRREGVDARLFLHHVDRRSRRPRGNRHLLDHVQNATLQRIRTVGVNQRSAQILGHHLSAPRERGDAVEACAPHHQRGRPRDLEHQQRVHPMDVPDRCPGGGVFPVAHQDGGSHVERAVMPITANTKSRTRRLVFRRALSWSSKKFEAICFRTRSRSGSELDLRRLRDGLAVELEQTRVLAVAEHAREGHGRKALLVRVVFCDRVVEGLARK